MNFSPMMKQYLATKEQYKDCILLYRLGDFYEMFFDDAKKASEILDLILTSRVCGDNKKAPMCGVPYHAVENYISKLVNAGQKVAICEQLTEPTGKGVVERGVVRVVTAGTVMESNILEDSRNNYIACLSSNGHAVGMAICDISTGFFATSQFENVSIFSDLQEFISSFAPSEIIANSQGVKLNSILECIKAGHVSEISPYQDSNFDVNKAKTALLNHYNVSTLDGFGFEGKDFAISACGALLQYLKDTQKRQLPHLENIRYLENKHFMSIDYKSRRNLEISTSTKEGKRKGSLLWLLDKTSTSMGARLLANIVEHPLQDAARIKKRLDGVEELFANFMLREELTNVLSKMFDIERLAGKIAYSSAMPKDLLMLKQSIAVLPQLKKLIENQKSAAICSLNAKISHLNEVFSLIDKAICDEDEYFRLPTTLKDGGYIKKGCDAALDQVIDMSENGSKHISALEEYERNRTGIRTLKLGYNKVFGYYFEVSNSFKDKTPPDFIRKQTTVNGERFVSEQLKVLEEQMLKALESRQQLEKQIFEQLRTKLLPYIPEIQTVARSVAELDCLLSLAKVAVANNYTKPTIKSSHCALNIVGGRHPIVEQFIKRENFITNDTLLDTDQNRTMIITGPNMAGKSTYMRQVALIVLMAHIGSFVPAESCETPIVDKIFTRVGASDDLSFNQSTFMVEMVEVANIMNNATKNSLIILDEVGRGTSTFDGLSIAWAVLEHVSQQISAKTLFATHYHELTELEGRVAGVKNFKISVKEHQGGIIFLHKIARGGANKSFGIEVATLAGVPKSVCNRAREIVQLLENSDINFSLNDIKDTADVQKQQQVDKQTQEIIAILRDIDINRCSPLEAFDILTELTKRLV